MTILVKFECCFHVNCGISGESDTIRLIFIKRSPWRGNIRRIEELLKILDQGDAEAHQRPREVSSRKVGS